MVRSVIGGLLNVISGQLAHYWIKFVTVTLFTALHIQSSAVPIVYVGCMYGSNGAVLALTEAVQVSFNLVENHLKRITEIVS